MSYTIHNRHHPGHIAPESYANLARQGVGKGWKGRRNDPQIVDDKTRHKTEGTSWRAVKYKRRETQKGSIFHSIKEKDLLPLPHSPLLLHGGAAGVWEVVGGPRLFLQTDFSHQ